MANELSLGTQRIGSFIDFYSDTPELQVTLEHSERGIGVRLSWTSMDSPYARWFIESGPRIRIPPLPDLPPAPRRALFVDSYGSVLLLRCRANGYHMDVAGPGSGTLWSRIAILGPRDDIDYENPHGIQSEISGFREWLGVTSWSRQQSRVGSKGVYTFVSQTPEVIEVGTHDGITLSVQPAHGVENDRAGARHILLDDLLVITQSSEPKSWDTHYQLHQAIRDLMLVSSWVAESCIPRFARHEDDVVSTGDGKTYPATWQRVVVPSSDRSPIVKGRRSHLLRYDELGTSGIVQWIKLRQEFARALDPVITSVDLNDSWPATRLAHTGPGLEALGYLLLRRDGMPEKKAAYETLESKLNRVLQDLGDCLPFDGAGWVERTVETYNALKHANRSEPDPVDVINAWQQSTLAARAWVAVELGVAHSTLKTRLTEDRGNKQWVRSG